MVTGRTPFQGIRNILRFNYHFYLIALGGILSLGVVIRWLPVSYRPFFGLLCGMAVSTTLVSLLVSFYVYDLSSLYQLQWLEVPKTPQRLVNIHAGFDESSVLLKEKFPTTDLIIFDFYDPARHTEVSIRRARKAYPPHPDTQHIRTDRLPLPDQYADLMCVLFAAHEIRNAKERIQFFQELHRSLQSDGHVVVVEHLRDIFNFISYTIGVFHFFPEPTWRKTFILGGFRIRQRKKITPFVTCYVLEKDGTAP